MPAKTQKSRRSQYVEAASGWPAFFLCLLLASVLGCGFRLYFSPVRLKTWIASALDHQKKSMVHPFALSFESASLRLSDGAYFPQLAVVVSDVRVAPAPHCHPEASVFIGELRLPFRVLSLLAGRAAVGVIGARDVRVDLDGLRAKCEATTEPTRTTKPSVAETAVALSAPKDKNDSTRPWWTEEQFETVSSFVEGFEFSHATLQFENKTKEIDLDSFRVLLRGGGQLQVTSEVRIPPSVAYGEQIPPLRIEGSAVSQHADLSISARLSEGSLVTKAQLVPSVEPSNGQALDISAVLQVKSLPLSLLSALMRKAGLANEKFDPKFLWLDGTAKIAGPFQGLFQKSPLKLEACRIQGDGTDILLANAERSPQGNWKPFEVQVASLDLAKLFQTIGVHGPEGVASNFGRLNGAIQVDSQDDARFQGSLKNAQIEFSNRKVHAAQTIESTSVALTIRHDQVKARFADFILLKGAMKGSVDVELDRQLKNGAADVNIVALKFDPDVQAVLTGGDLGSLSGRAHGKIEDSHITDYTASMKITETQAAAYSFGEVSVSSTRTGDSVPKISLDAPSLTLRTASLNPVLFVRELGHELGPLEKPHLEVVILGNGDVDWLNARASLAQGKIQMSSRGSMNADHVIDGTIAVDYPRIKNLKWTMKGPLLAPTLVGVGEAFKALQERAEIDDKVLGL